MSEGPVVNNSNELVDSEDIMYIILFMSKSKVYFMDLKAKPGLSILNKFENLLEKHELLHIYKKNDIIAIKVHFGESGNVAYLRPDFSQVLIYLLKKIQAKPFYTDTNTLYHGMRSNAVDHIYLAGKHGYNLFSGAPVIIADGIKGLDFNMIKTNTKHFKEIKIASGIYQADGMIVFSHFKGHSGAGFGGAIKNIGMGMAPVPGKKEQHSKSIPYIKHDICVKCGKCILYCPLKALSNEGDSISLNSNTCIGCGECIAVCPNGAIKTNWDTSGKIFLERMAEYASGIYSIKKEKALFINALIDISPDCDCWDYNDVPLTEDIGFLASYDPVAIDQASFDLVHKAERNRNSQHYRKDNTDSVFHAMAPEVDSEYILEYSEQINIGKRQYEIIKV